LTARGFFSILPYYEALDQPTPAAPRRRSPDAPPRPPASRRRVTQRAIRRLVVPGALLLLVGGVLLWGLLAQVLPTPTGAGAPFAAPAGPASPTIPLALGSSPAPSPAATTPTLPPAAVSTPAPSLAPATPTIPPAAGSAPAPSPTVPTPTLPPTVGSAPAPSPSLPPSAAQPLLGRRIGLDPGHGPRGDLGAVLVDPDTGRLILSEDTLNLDVGLRTAALLRARGAAVVLTRETKDTFTAPWPPDTNGDGIKGGQSDDLQERVDIINDFHAEVFLSIHANSSANPAKRKGIQALFCGGGTPGDCPFEAQEKRLGLLALDQLTTHLAAIGYSVEQSELRNDLWQDTPSDPPGHLFLLGPPKLPSHPRALHMPGIVVESLYITSRAEAAELQQDPARQAIALAYADALQAYLLTPAP